MHLVSVDRRNAIISLRTSGFVSVSDSERAAADLHAAIASLGERAGQHGTLYDLTDVQVASGETIEHFAHYFFDPRYTTIWARRVAFVTSSALLTLQLKRVQLDRDNIRIFSDRVGAMAWLLES